jgi:hypothetical protein
LAEAEKARRGKETALEAQDFERAAGFRDRERELADEIAEAMDERLQEELLAAARARLGLG